MYLYSRLQWLKTVTASGAQPARESVDVLDYKLALLQVTVSKASSAGQLDFEHALVRDERRFLALPGANSVSLTAVAVTIIEVENPLRFLRWVVSSLGTEAVFQIDLVARPEIPPT